MADIAALGITVTSDGVARATTDLDRLDKASARAERGTGKLGTASQAASGQVDRLAGSADRLARNLVRGFQILTTGILARALANLTSEWTDLNSRVQLASGGQAQATAVMGRLSDMARRTYSDLSLTAEGWLQNQRALRDMGLTLQQTLDFTEALNNAMVVSGAKAARAASVQDALSKAMALGSLQGINLNTVIQSGGRVAELLAEELGTTVSGLRRLGAEGKITGDVIQRALIGNLQTLRDEADSMPATISDGILLIRNSMLQLVGTWDTIIGSSALVSAALVAIADNMERVAAIALAFGLYMGGRWVASMVAARAATMGLSVAMVALRGAISATGIGLLIIGAGELIYRFGQLVKGAGGFGNALVLLKNVAVEVFGRIKDAFGLVPLAVQAGSAEMKSWFLSALHDMLQAFQDLTWSVAEGLNALFGTSLQGARIGAISGMGTGSLSRAVGEAMVDASSARSALSSAAGAIGAPLTSVQALRDAVNAADDLSGSLDDATGSADALAEALAGTGGAGGGGVAGAGQMATDMIEDGLRRAQERTEEWKSTIQDAFVGFVTGAKSFKQAVVDIIGKLAEMMAMKAFEVLWGGGALGGGIGGGIGGFIGKLFGFASGTSYAPGGLALVGERGPELVNLPAGARVYNAQASRAMAGQAGGTVRIIIEEAAGFAARVRTEAQGVAVQVVSAAGRSQADERYLTGAT